MRILGVIPARLASTRFPEKLLAELTPGVSLLQHTVANAQTMLRAGLLSALIVAVDHERLAENLASMTPAVKVIMTSPDCANGTERSAEALKIMEAENPGEKLCSIIINLQGDEPLLPYRAVCILQRLACRHFTPAAQSQSQSQSQSANRLPLAALTLMKPITEKRALAKNAVKVVTDTKGYALYFSRAPIPASSPAQDVGSASSPHADHYQHIGLYAYSRDFLQLYPQLSPTPLEQSEKLEQLRILEHGYRILVAPFIPKKDEILMDVNDEADLHAVRQKLMLS